MSGRQRSLWVRRGSAAVALVLAGLVSAALWPGCRPAPPVPAADPPASLARPPLSLLLLGYDGLSWNVLRPLARSGRLPALARLIEAGSAGNVESLQPMISPRIWNSVATGKLPEKHGIEEFMVRIEGPPGESRPRYRMPTSSERRVRALWNILSERGRSAAVVGWWNSWPAEPVRGAVVSMLGWPYLAQRHGMPMFYEPLAGLSRLSFPESWQAQALLDCRIPEEVGPAERERWLLDPDPWAYAKDLSVVAQAERLRQRYRPDLLALYVQGIDVASHLHWDELERVARYYRLGDELWERLAAGMDEETAVVLLSDHGFQGLEDARGEASAAIMDVRWKGIHLRHGVIALAGPPFRRGYRLRDAGELDVAPTLLAALGLPVARDMDGGVLERAFEPAFLRAHPVEFVPTYEIGPRSPAPDAPQSGLDEAVEERLRSIGYAF